MKIIGINTTIKYINTRLILYHYINEFGYGSIVDSVPVLSSKTTSTLTKL